MSNLSHIPTSSYKLGRLSLAIPDFMLPQICKFDYTWDSRTSRNESHHLGYPISIQEYPYNNMDNKRDEWGNNITQIKNKNKKRLIFDWDVSSVFKLPSYFICINKEAALFCYYVVLLENQCILHIIARRTFRYPKKTRKGVRNRTNTPFYI